jgi:hypothetical protein
MSLVAALVVGFIAGLRELVRAFSWTAANQWALASGARAFFVAAALLLAGYLKVRREEANRSASG